MKLSLPESWIIMCSHIFTLLHSGTSSYTNFNRSCMTIRHVEHSSEALMNRDPGMTCMTQHVIVVCLPPAVMVCLLFYWQVGSGPWHCFKISLCWHNNWPLFECSMAVILWPWCYHNVAWSLVHLMSPPAASCLVTCLVHRACSWHSVDHSQPLFHYCSHWSTLQHI